MPTKIIFYDTDVIKVEHQHGHRHQVNWYENSSRTRKHHSIYVPEQRWNRYMTEQDSYEANANLTRAIYRFKTQENWSLQKMHKNRTQRKRAIGRKNKQSLQMEWGTP